MSEESRMEYIIKNFFRGLTLIAIFLLTLVVIMQDAALKSQMGENAWHAAMDNAAQEVGLGKFLGFSVVGWLIALLLVVFIVRPIVRTIYDFCQEWRR